MNQLNGFELAGRPMKVGHVTEKQEAMAGGNDRYDNEELERHGETIVIQIETKHSASFIYFLLNVVFEQDV